MPHIQVREWCAQMSEFEKDHVVGLKEADWSHRQIARHLSKSDATIRWCWQEWVNHGLTQCLKESSKPRETTGREDRATVRVALTAPDASLSSIVHATSASVITRTIHRWLTERVWHHGAPCIVYHWPLYNVKPFCSGVGLIHTGMSLTRVE